MFQTTNQIIMVVIPLKMRPCSVWKKNTILLGVKKTSSVSSKTHHLGVIPIPVLLLHSRVDVALKIERKIQQKTMDFHKVPIIKMLFYYVPSFVSL